MAFKKAVLVCLPTLFPNKESIGQSPCKRRRVTPHATQQREHDTAFALGNLQHPQHLDPFLRQGQLPVLCKPPINDPCVRSIFRKRQCWMSRQQVSDSSYRAPVARRPWLTFNVIPDWWGPFIPKGHVTTSQSDGWEGNNAVLFESGPL